MTWRPSSEPPHIQQLHESTHHPAPDPSRRGLAAPTCEPRRHLPSRTTRGRTAAAGEVSITRQGQPVSRPARTLPASARPETARPALLIPMQMRPRQSQMRTTTPVPFTSHRPSRPTSHPFQPPHSCSIRSCWAGLTPAEVWGVSLLRDALRPRRTTSGPYSSGAAIAACPKRSIMSNHARLAAGAALSAAVELSGAPADLGSPRGCLSAALITSPPRCIDGPGWGGGGGLARAANPPIRPIRLYGEG